MEASEATTRGIVLPSPTFLPRRYKPRNVGEWTGHLTFASDLIVSLQPQLIVELGTHWGEAYFTFCQTVQEHGLSSVCYAVDHWVGDDHAGHYGEEVFDDVSSYNGKFYRQFSYLLRKSFDDARSQFSDGSIGLLHIDGLHTYEAASHDFRNWWPKVQPGGIVLLHDICPRHQDFGVWRLWEEIASEFPDHFEFHHSWGLGVVRKPGIADETPLTELLFHSTPELREETRRHYVIYASHLENTLGRVAPMPVPRAEPTSIIRVQVFPSIDGIYSPETCRIHLMKAGEWGNLVFHFPDPKARGPLRVDPGSEPSLIEVGDILIHSGETEELLWSSQASSRSSELSVAGTALRFADELPVIINPGDDPQLILAIPSAVQGPLKLTISLKVTPAAAQVMEFLQRVSSEHAASDKARTAALTAITAAREELQTALEKAQVAFESERQLRLDAQQTIAGVENSLSWKITSPVRAVMTALRGGARKSR